jgi:hypothetical protein
MELRDLIRDFEFGLNDLSLTGMLVSPIWFALGVLSGDVVMLFASLTLALVSTLHVRPRLVARVARLRGA